MGGGEKPVNCESADRKKTEKQGKRRGVLTWKR